MDPKNEITTMETPKKLKPQEKKRKPRKPRAKLDPRKYELCQGEFEPILYKNLRQIYGDSASHGLRRHQIRLLKKSNDKNPNTWSRLGKLRLLSKLERKKSVTSNVEIQTTE